MKKIFILFFSIGIISVASAQSSHIDRDMKEARSVVLGGSDKNREYKHDKDGNTSDNKNRDWEKRIREDYNKEIQEVRRDRHLSASEKNKRIKKLEKERDARIKSVNKSFSGKKAAYSKHDGKNKDRK